MDLTVSEIRINSTGKLDLVNTTVTTTANETYGTTTYTLVSDGGELSIQDAQIHYGMVWLVGGNASITTLVNINCPPLAYPANNSGLTSIFINIMKPDLGNPETLCG